MSKKKGDLTRFKVKKRKVNKMRLFLLVIVGLVVAYFVISALKIVRLNNEKAEVEQKNQELKETIEDLNQELEIISSDQYMERLARKKLKLVRSNEILFILPNLRTNEEDEEMGPTDIAQKEAEDLVEAKKIEDAKKAEEEAKKAEAEGKGDSEDSEDSKESKDSKDSGDDGSKDTKEGSDESSDEGSDKDSDGGQND